MSGLGGCLSNQWSSETLVKGMGMAAGQPYGLHSMFNEDEDLRTAYLATLLLLTRFLCSIVREKTLYHFVSKSPFVSKRVWEKCVNNTFAPDS